MNTLELTITIKPMSYIITERREPKAKLRYHAPGLNIYKLGCSCDADRFMTIAVIAAQARGFKAGDLRRAGS
jgi:hypothetical protein